MSRRSLRMIFPDLVLGRSSAQMIRLGLASLPIWRPTCSRSPPSVPPPRMTAVAFVLLLDMLAC
jgi:hypothetical protein